METFSRGQAVQGPSHHSVSDCPGYLFIRPFLALMQGDSQGHSVSLIHPKLLAQHVQHLQLVLHHIERHQRATVFYCDVLLRRNGCPPLFSAFTRRGSNIYKISLSRGPVTAITLILPQILESVTSDFFLP